jgi:hypothetical protein
MFKLDYRMCNSVQHQCIHLPRGSGGLEEAGTVSRIACLSVNDMRDTLRTGVTGLKVE